MKIAKLLILLKRTMEYILKSVTDSNKNFNITKQNVCRITQDKNITLNVNDVSQKVYLKTIGATNTILNGYGLEINETYDLNEGDVLEIDSETIFQLQINAASEIKRSNDSPVHEHKKMKVASIFQTSKTKPNKVSEISGKWETIGTDLLVFTPENLESRSKIAGFDLDGTVIKPKSGKQFPQNMDDWELFHKDITEKLKDLYDDDFKLVIFTNQLPLGRDSNQIKFFKEKISNIFMKLGGIPIQLFAALHKTIYRKPMNGMWDDLVKEKNNDIKINIEESFYVGDAAGRPKNWEPKKRKDHSMADRLFALNIGLKFYTPEEFFFNSKRASYEMPLFDPRNLSIKGNKFDLNNLDLEIIIMVGSPGSGKSFFCKRHIVKNGYEYVNRDTIGSWQKCIKLVEESLQNKRCVVVDNTNRDKETRSRYLKVAKQYNVSCRCFVMNVDKHHAKHNNKFRELIDSKHIPVSEIIISSYFKNFEQPSLNEGFSEIIKIDFHPFFDNSEHEKLYKMFLLES